MEKSIKEKLETLDLSDAKGIYKFAFNNRSLLDNDTINMLVDAIIKTRNVKYIYSFAMNIDDLSIALFEKLIDFVIVFSYVVSKTNLMSFIEVVKIDNLEISLNLHIINKIKLAKKSVDCFNKKIDGLYTDVLDLLTVEEGNELFQYIDETLKEYDRFVSERQIINEEKVNCR